MSEPYNKNEAAQWRLAGIGLGANLGERIQTLLAAWRELGMHPGICPVKISHPYLSEPVGMHSEHDFINAVGLIKSTLSPLKLLRFMLDLETRHGRRRQAGKRGYQDRPLDLDLLFFDKFCLHDEQLTLPHPHLPERLFVLIPLAELLPRWRHPVSGDSTGRMIARLATQEGQKISRVSWTE